MSQTQCNPNGLTSHDNSTVQQTDNEAMTLAESPVHEAGEQDRGKLLLELAAVKEKDPTHILFRRHVGNASLCLDLEANFLERDGIILRQMVESGDPNIEECVEKYITRLGRYHQFGCQFSKILEFDEPSSFFLSNVLYLAREKWGEARGIHLNAEDEDWASLYETDKFNQVISLLPHRPLARRIMRAFSRKPEEEGQVMLTFIPMEYARFAIVGLFNCFVGVFVSAPVAIQALNVTSPVGMISTYLAFVLVAGFLIQSLIKGFTRQLLVYLAYAGVMAAVMRLKE